MRHNKSENIAALDSENLGPAGHVQYGLEMLGIDNTISDRLRREIVQTAGEIEDRERGLLPQSIHADMNRVRRAITSNRLDNFRDTQHTGAKRHGFIVEDLIFDKQYNYPGLYVPGVYGNAKVANIHFTPKASKSRMGTKRHNSKAESFKEKQQVMIDGIEGVISYLALVEASYLPRPDIVTGETNETMAKVAERVGLKRAGTWKRELNTRPSYRMHSELPAENDNKIVYNSYEGFREAAVEMFLYTYPRLKERQQAQQAVKAGKKVLTLAR